MPHRDSKSRKIDETLNPDVDEKLQPEEGHKKGSGQLQKNIQSTRWQRQGRLATLAYYNGDVSEGVDVDMSEPHGAPGKN